MEADFFQGFGEGIFARHDYVAGRAVGCSLN